MVLRTTAIRRWKIMFLFSYDASDWGRILDALIWADASDSIIEKVEGSISANGRNEGFCFSNPAIRRSVIGVGKTTTGPEVLNSTIHEITHLALHIAEEDKIDPYSEELAYLIGDISHSVSDIVCELSCPHCNR